MAAPVAAAAVKVVGPENLGKILLYLVAIALAALLALPAVIMILVTVTNSSPASAALPAVGAGPVVVGEWGSPMAGYDLRRGFGWNPVNGCTFCSKDHKGQDMGSGCGSPIYSAGPGTVTAAGDSGGFGTAVTVDHGGGVTTLYAHMTEGSTKVAAGETVAAGTVIGAEGSTGNSTGCHLHFETRENGQAIDPAPFMRERGITL